MSKGLKRICMHCGMRFYDMDKSPIICPSCETEFTGEEKVKARRGRASATPEAPAKEAPKVVDEDEIEDIDADDDIISLDEVDEDDANDEDDDDTTLTIDSDPDDLDDPEDDLEDDLDDLKDDDDDDK